MSRGIKENRRNCKAGAVKALFPALFFVAFLLFFPLNVRAAGNVRFGSLSYSPDQGTNFNVGVYVENNADDGLLVGSYSVTLSYDPNVITYVSGGSTGGNGSVVINGTSPDGNVVQHMLTFTAVNSGNTNITVAGAVINDTTGTAMGLNPLPSAPINVQGGKTTPPDRILLNGKEIPGLAAGRTEYTFSIPYADELEIVVPEGYHVTAAMDEDLTVGRNEITLDVSQDNCTPITYTLHVNMEKNRREDASENHSEEDSAAKDKKEKSSEKKASDKKELPSEITLPPMPESTSAKDTDSLGAEKRSLRILAGIAGLIVAIVLLKLLNDRISAGIGRRSDTKKLQVKHNLALQEKVDEAAAPFEFAMIDEKAENGEEIAANEFHLKKAEHNQNPGNPSNASQSGAHREAVKLDFGKRISASRMAREEAETKEKEAASASESITDAKAKAEFTKKDVEEYVNSLDTFLDESDDDFVDLDDIAERGSGK